MNSYLAKALVSLALVSCGNTTENSTQVKITNGIEISENTYPAVVALEIKDQTGYVGPCTGTFISDETLMTAAHCLDGMVYTRYKGMNPIDVYIHPFFVIGASKYDLALVKFPPNTAPAVMPVATEVPADGDRLIMVGFGHNATHWDPRYHKVEVSEGSTNNVKRIGYNTYDETLHLFVEDLITFVGFTESQGIDTDGQRFPTGELAGAAPGDSGGPLIIEGKGVVGVTSYGYHNDEALGNQSWNVYTSLMGSEAASVFETARRGGFKL